MKNVADTSDTADLQKAYHILAKRREALDDKRGSFIKQIQMTEIEMTKLDAIMEQFESMLKLPPTTGQVIGLNSGQASKKAAPAKQKPVKVKPKGTKNYAQASKSQVQEQYRAVLGEALNAAHKIGDTFETMTILDGFANYYGENYCQSRASQAILHMVQRGILSRSDDKQILTMRERYTPLAPTSNTNDTSSAAKQPDMLDSVMQQMIAAYG